MFKKATTAQVLTISKSILLFAAIFFIMFQFSGFILNAGKDDEALGEGKTFNYNFTIRDLAGNEVDVRTLKNKVVFLNLWATWCGPCRKEMPSIQELYNKVDHNKIAFVMLSIDKPEDHQKVTKYISDKAFSFPVYEVNNGLPSQLQVSVIPTTFVIGPDGKIKLKRVGTDDYNTEEFKSYLEGL
jgi:thiol-disulfide isomerase/thioredoxin